MRLILALTLALAGAARAETPRVVTDLAVTHGLTAAVMAGVGTPRLLIDGPADPHSVQLRPAQTRALAEADLVIWVGAPLTPWLDRVLGTVAEDAATLALLDTEGTALRGFDAADGHDATAHADHADDDHGDHADDHDGGAAEGDHGEHGPDEDVHEEHGHDEDAHDEHGHGHDGGLDPHAWLDPANARTWAAAIAATLADLDPGNADRYAANARDLVAAIDAAEAEARSLLAAAGHRPIVVFHDAYGYFARAFDVPVAGAVALGDATAPGARALAALRETVADRDVACVFAEPNHPPALARAVAADTGTGFGTLDPTGATLPTGPDHYPALILGMARAIADCTGA